MFVTTRLFIDVLNYQFADGHIESVDMNCIMLETSRVLIKDSSLRPFKIFQVVVSALTHTSRSEAESGIYMFTPALQDAIRGSKTYPARWEAICAENLDYLRGLLSAVGLSEPEWQSALRAVAAVMHLQCLVVSGSDTAQITTATKSHLGYAERLLGMEPGTLSPALHGGKSLDGLKTPGDVKMAIDGMSAEIYSRTMYFLLGFCTRYIANEMAALKGIAGEPRARPSLQLVDAFGYENIAEGGSTPNGIAQFCINTLEERLQEQYLTRVFKAEMDFLRSEGLEPASVAIPDLEPALSVVDRPPSGIMSLIEEASLFPRGSDNSLLDKIYSAHTKSRLVKSAGRAAKASCFIMKHSFGDVLYDLDGFTAANKTKPSSEVLEIINKLSLECLGHGSAAASLAPAAADAAAATAGEKKAGSSMAQRNAEKSQAKAALFATRFRDSVGGLLQQLDRDTSPIYVLCVRSNADSRGFTIDPDGVGSQIRFLAIVEQAQFAKECYPYRRNYREFYERYRPMLGFQVAELPRKLGISDNLKASCKALLRSCAVLAGLARLPEGQEGPMFGDTNIFLRTPLVEALEETRFQVMQRYGQAAVLLQSHARQFLFTRRYEKMRLGTITLQAVARRRACRKTFLKSLNSALLIKSLYLTRRESRRFRRIKHAVAVIKSKVIGKLIMRLRYQRLRRAVRMAHFLARGFIIRQQANHVFLAILILQRAAKEFLIRNRAFYKRQTAVVTVQRSFRGWQTRRECAPEVKTLQVLRDQRRAHRVVRSLQANFRRLKITRRFQVIFNATLIVQRWCRARKQRFQFLQVKALNQWLQSTARRIIASNRVNALRLIVMMKQEFDRLKEVREFELSFLKNDFASADPAKGPQLGGGLHMDGHGKYVRFLIGFDVLLDSQEAYPKGWIGSLLQFDKQLQAKGRRRLSMIAVGSTHTVLVDSASNVYTFGIGDEGQLGHGTRADEAAPRLVETLVYQASVTEGALSRGVSTRVEVKAIAAGRDHTLLLTGSGRVYSWGSNRRGQLGHSDFSSSALPRMVSVKNVRKISCGAHHSVCLADPGVAYVWGAKETLGCGGSILLSSTNKFLAAKSSQPTEIVDVSEPRTLPFFAKRRVQDIFCGDVCTFVRSSGSLFMWGNNAYGQLGTGNRLNRNEPILLPLPESCTAARIEKSQLSVGGRHAVLLVAGKVLSWGWNKSGQADGGLTEEDVLSPTELDLRVAYENAGRALPASAPVRITQVCAGWRHSSALTAEGDIITWGRAGLLADSRETPAAAAASWSGAAKSSVSLEDEVKAAAYLSPAPIIAQLPIYAAGNRVINMFGCHSNAVSITAADILFKDAIVTETLKTQKYVSPREVKPILYHTGGVKQQEYSKKFRESLGSWAKKPTTAESADGAGGGGGGADENKDEKQEGSQNSPKYLRLPKSKSRNFSADKSFDDFPNSHASFLEKQRTAALEMRDREGRVTEHGLLSLFSPMKSKSSDAPKESVDDKAAAADAYDTESPLPRTTVPFQTGNDSRESLSKANPAPKSSPKKQYLFASQKQRSQSLTPSQTAPKEDPTSQKRRSFATGDEMKFRKGAVDSAGLLVHDSDVNSARAGDSRGASPPRVSTKSPATVGVSAAGAAEGANTEAVSGLSLSAVSDLAAMIQSIKKESLQQMTISWRY